MKWIAIAMNDRRILSRQERPIFSDGLWFIVDADRPEQMPIAVVDRGDDHHAPTRAEAERRARLIAAAPAMAEALRKLLASLDDEGIDDSDWPALEGARAALALAESGRG